MAAGLLCLGASMSTFDPDATTELVSIPLEEDEDFAEAPTMPIPLFELPNRGMVRPRDGRKEKTEDPAAPR